MTAGLAVLDPIVAALARRRVALGMSQRELASLVGTSQNVISEFERGLVTAKLSTVRRISAALGVAVGVGLDDSTLGTEEPQTPPPAGRPMVSVDPRMRFGEPHIGGVSVEAIAGAVWAGEPVHRVAEDFNRTPAEVLIACWFKARHGGITWKRRWGGWLADAEPLLVRGRTDGRTPPAHDRRPGELRQWLTPPRPNYSG